MTQPELIELFYSSTQTSKFFGISTTTLLRWTEDGKIQERHGIHSVRGENGHHYYLKADVDRVWDELVTEADNEATRNRSHRD